jgi:hypothetical protein
MNEEFPVSTSHQLVLITSLPFVHTARRYYRSFQLMSASDWSRKRIRVCSLACREDVQIIWNRGSKSRNKVSVGEPADGSLLDFGCGLETHATRETCRTARFEPGPGEACRPQTTRPSEGGSAFGERCGHPTP